MPGLRRLASELPGGLESGSGSRLIARSLRCWSSWAARHGSHLLQQQKVGCITVHVRHTISSCISHWKASCIRTAVVHPWQVDTLLLHDMHACSS